MNSVKNIGIFIILYGLALIQSSFLIHFKIFWFIPNLILIFILILNFVESPEKKSGLFFAAFGGFLVDVFSNYPIGLNLSIYLISAFVIKYLLKKYVRISFREDA